MNKLTFAMHRMGLVSYLAAPATIMSVQAYVACGGPLGCLGYR